MRLHCSIIRRRRGGDWLHLPMSVAQYIDEAIKKVIVVPMKIVNIVIG